MAKYNEQKVFEEISKLNCNEAYQLLQRIKDFIQKMLEQEQKEAEEKLANLKSKIEKVNYPPTP